MKKLFISLIVLFFIATNFGLAGNNSIAGQDISSGSFSEDFVLFEADNNIASDYIIEITINNPELPASCTVDADLTITTEDGDSVTISVKVTADNCKEAVRVLSKVAEALSTE